MKTSGERTNHERTSYKRREDKRRRTNGGRMGGGRSSRRMNGDGRKNVESRTSVGVRTSDDRTCGGRIDNSRATYANSRIRSFKLI